MFQSVKFADFNILCIESEQIKNPTGVVTLVYTENFIYDLINYIQPKQNCIIVYCGKMEYKHAFETGLKIDVVYWSNEAALDKHNFFFKTLYKILVAKGGLSERHILAFLIGLYKGNVYEREGKEKMIEKITQMEALTMIKCAGVAAKNEVTLETHPNFLNLFITSQIQQKSLNVKRSCFDGKNDVEKFEFYQPGMLFQYDVVYMKQPTLLFIEATLEAIEFENILRLPIYSYKHLYDNKYIIGIDKHFFHLIYNISGKKSPIQYTYCEPCEDMTISLSVNLKISDEIMAIKSVYIFFYAIMCIEVLEEFMNETHGYFQIIRVASLPGRTFYYVKFFLYKGYTSKMYMLFNKFINKKCMKGNLNETLLHMQWQARCCLHLFYHTHFQLSLNNMTDEEIIASKFNITTYKYLSCTSALDLNVYDETTALILANCILQVEKAFVMANMSEKKCVKFSQVNPSVGGPLLAAISTRTCDNVTQNLDQDKWFSINENHYLASLHNTIYTNLGNNPKNKFSWKM